ncbi:peptidoglycan D,D-transpeptidase FtsI family protein [Paenibacillus sp. XY044]|uniref:peptidoglycan D,D-transpeptidase FtsI family protein n=1 Tax=Paenibacillus sp. XY044 TaxID=2026089 RepID=UPI00359C5297
MNKLIGRNVTGGKENEPKSGLNLRINLFFFSTFVIFCVIIIRLAVIQFVEADTLTEKETGQNTKNIPLPPARGNILDATGTKLAFSTPVQSLYITLQKDYSNATEKSRKNRQEAEQLAQKIADVFNGLGDPIEKKDIIEAMDLDSKKEHGYYPRRIKMDLSQREIAYFMERKSEFPGIEIIEESKRIYNKDTIAVQTVGYIKSFKHTESLKEYDEARKDQDDPGLVYTPDELVGVDGIEMSFQQELRGKNGYKVVSVTPGNIVDGVEEMVPPEKGNDVWLTINKQVQQTAEQAIMDQLSWVHSNPVSGETHPNALTGYAVAMEVDTGKIVAMASMPDYDTNVWGDGGISTKDYEKIKANYQNGTITPISSGKSGHNMESTLLLGSTMKPLSVLIGLQEHLFSTTTPYNDVGIAYFGKEKKAVRNSQNHAYGYLRTPAEAIEHSSNAFMVNMVGDQLFKKYINAGGDYNKGVDVWDKYMKQFGLGVSTEIDLPNEYLGNREYMPDKNGKFPQTGSAQGSLVYASFGQEGKYTTLQLAQYTATLANEGERIKPQIVSKITDQNGKVVQTFKREVLNKTDDFDKSYWSLVRRGMNTDVKSAFAGFPYDFARKTGTSQQQSSDGVNRDNGVFIAYAPRNNPKLAVAVVIPEGGFGAYSAAPIARKIFDAYDQEYGLDGVPKKNKQAMNP